MKECLARLGRCFVLPITPMYVFLITPQLAWAAPPVDFVVFCYQELEGSLRLHAVSQMVFSTAVSVCCHMYYVHFSHIALSLT